MMRNYNNYFSSGMNTNSIIHSFKYNVYQLQMETIKDWCCAIDQILVWMFHIAGNENMNI